MFDFIGILTRAMLAMPPAPVPAAPPPPPVQPAVVAVEVAAPVATAAPSKANQVVDEVQKFYATIKQVTAQFRQSVTYDTFGSTKTSDGQVYIQKPGKMRWDYLEKKKDRVVVKKSFISNGTYLYVVEHDNLQVVQKNLQQDLMPVAVSFLTGKGDLKAEFNAELDTSGKYGAKGDYVLKLTPKKTSAQYKNLFLVVSAADYHVTQSVIIDSSNNVNNFRFYAPDFEKPIKPSWFEFDKNSVKNYRIIDADQQTAPAGSGAPAPAPLPPPPAPAAPKK
jgi:outer membrane lipoprotein carrier protein